MVDDILTIQKCGPAAEEMNHKVNAFIEQKKLTLGHKKCVKIHVGKQCNQCSEHFVHEKVIKEAQEVKYLGDILHENGKPKRTIIERVQRGYAVCGQIFALLKDLPLGSLKVQIGLELRKAWLINGILYNSEVWHNITESDIAQFVKIDKYLLRGLLSAHAKSQLENLYLETAALPIPYIVTSRRLIYLKQLLDRPEYEITKRIYRCQKENSVQGDWCELIVKDFQKISMVMSEAQIEHLTVQDYKDIKKKVRIAAFDELNTLKQGHKEVEYNQYSDILKSQSYTTDKEITNTQCKL